MTTRVRFAPSPTGYLHVGSARTALFNWLYARSVGGTFVLRIEDTDTERSRAEVIDGILETMEWLGLDWDEGPHLQSEARDRHVAAVEQLLADGAAYEDDGAVRFRLPEGETIGIDDAVRGRVEWKTDDLNDFVIRRSDGSPMFALANAIDDLDMGITHAIRGEDLLNVVPQGLLLMRALGAESDMTYAHLPLLVDHQRKKLSKRRDDVAIEDYRARGYLPEAMVNFLALLGWGPKDEVEVRPISEIVELFKLEDINSSAAFFDLKKLQSFNGEYIRMLSEDRFVELAHKPDPCDDDIFRAMVPHIQQRAKTLDEVPFQVDWMMVDEPPVDEAAWDKVMVNGPAAREILTETIEAYEATDTWDHETLHGLLLAIGEGHELKLGKAQAPVRVAVTGKTVGPPLFEALAVLGKNKTMTRLRTALERL